MPQAEGGEGQQQPDHPLALGEEDGAADPLALGLDRERGEEGERGEGEQDHAPAARGGEIVSEDHAAPRRRRAAADRPTSSGGRRPAS